MRTIDTLREHVPSLRNDRYLADDIVAAAALVDHSVLSNVADMANLMNSVSR